MQLHRLFLIVGIMLIPAMLVSCGQYGSTGDGTHATPTPTHVPSPAVTKAPFPTATAGAVSLRVGATFYHPTETISVTLSNQSTQAIYFPDHLTNCTVIQLQRQVDGNWENVQACLLLTLTRLYRLDAGKRLRVALVSRAAPRSPVCATGGGWEERNATGCTVPFLLTSARRNNRRME